MTNILRSQLTQGLKWVQCRIRPLPVFQPLIRWLQTGRIKSGAGAGLWFYAGDSNPEYRQGNNEMPVQEAISRHVKSGDVFYDIGANVGFFTVISARIVGQTGHVYVFEPVSENAQLIERNVYANGFENVTIFKQAVSRASGIGELQLAHYPGGASLASVAPPPDIRGTIPVELVAIDDLLAEHRAAPPNFVKIDVEGAELEVLHGMEQTIKLYRPSILFEIDDNSKDNFQWKAEACCRFLQRFEYCIEPLMDSYPSTGWHVGHYIALSQRL